MPIDLKPFSGIMNLDDSNEVIGHTQHKFAKNVRFYGANGNMRAEGINGTRLIPNSYLPTGDNECIGSFYDQVKQRVIWFNCNSLGRNGIYQYNLKTRTISPLLISFTNSADDILNFSLDYPIPSVNILYTTDEDGDELLWTDRLNRPMKLNLKDAIENRYGANWIVDYLTVARPMPLISPLCTYANDSSININNFRKKIFQLRYRFIYRDFTQSTWSPYSKLFTPIDPDSIADDVNPQKNNRIDMTIQTGAADVIKIEIGGRQAIEGADGFGFGDLLSITVLDKSLLSIGNDTTYIYNFFNDGAYVPVDPIDSTLLFDYVPLKANTQELLNGNVIIYGGITEGYNFDEVLDVDSEVTLVDNDEAGLTFSQIDTIHHTPPTDAMNPAVLFTFSGSMTNVVSVSISMHSNVGNVTYVATETGATIADLIANLTDNINDFSSVFNALGASDAYNTVPADSILIWHNSGLIDCTCTIVFSGATPVNDVSIAMYKHRSKYAFGLVYFDEFGVTNGVVNNVDFFINTPELDTTGDDKFKIPSIQFSINSQPPIWAKYFSWVRTNSLTFETLLTTVSAATLKDAALKYAYINIANQQDNKFNFPTYSFSEGDRVRVIGKYTDVVAEHDFPIINLLVDPTIDSSPRVGKWLQLPYTTDLSGFTTNARYYIEIYTPTLNTEPTLQTYFEFGESYNVLNAGTSTRSHQGMTQDQIFGTQPAIYNFVRGDFYQRQRAIALDVATPLATTNIWITDQSISDLYPSKLKGTGRAFVIDTYARQKFFGTLMRWSGAYQQDTNINKTNKFFPDTFDEIDRAKGEIQRFKVRDRILRVFQNRGCGQMGIYAKFIQDSGNTNVLATTDSIITSNNVSYYDGVYGLGDQYCGLVSTKNSDYFADPVTGNQCRLAGNGIIPISELYLGQFYIKNLLTPYNQNYIRTNGSKAKILGTYDYFDEQYIALLQSGTVNGSTILPYSFSFNELRNGYASFYDLFPEWLMSAETDIYYWLDGNIYVNDNTTEYCKFFNQQFSPSITLVFNDKEITKKGFNTIGYQSNQIWVSDLDGDIKTSTINPQTGLQQISQLIKMDYTIEENIRYAALLRDANSGLDKRLALLEGDFLKGNWIEMKLTYKGNQNSWILLPYINWEVSPRNF